MKTKLFSLLFAIVASIGTIYATEGALPGSFSVSEEKKVQFSQGNLQYQASTQTWRFAENQYDMIGSDNANISASYSGWIDLFGWGTGNNPTNVSTVNDDYNSFVDWGVNAISNGGNAANLWRTLTNDEWGYLFYNRTNAASLFGLGSVNGVNGMLILPDNWITPQGASFTPSTTQGLADQNGYYYNSNRDNYTHNTYTTEQWLIMEQNGAVFLPAANYREYTTDVSSVSSDGYYWSSTPYGTNYAYNLYIGSTYLFPQNYSTRFSGRSVRLIVEDSSCILASGTCGKNGNNNLIWELSCDSVLTISGTGAMADYEGISQPWYEIRENIKSVILEDGVTNIGNNAFYECTSLTSIVIPNSITSIGEYTFWKCSSLTSVNLANNVTNIGYWAFAKCSSLTAITIPHYATGIAGSTFSDCSSLTAINVAGGNMYRSLDGVLFSNDLSTLIAFPPGKSGEYIVPDQVTTIGDVAFISSAITSLTIPNNVTTINVEAFYKCSELVSVTIGSGVTDIGWNAFSGCQNLQELYCYATTPPVIDGWYSIPTMWIENQECTLYVPAHSINQYRTADVWNDFTNIQAIPGTSVAITANEDPQHVGTYYSTFYYSSGHYELPAAGVEAFVATVSGSDMNLTRIAGGAGVIPQGTAVILRSTIQNYTLTLSDDAPVFDGTNVLQGVDEATTTPANCYVLSAVDGVVGLYQYTGAQVGAHKAYLVYNGAGAPRRMRFVFDEENAVTGVEEAGSETANAVRSEKCIENGQLIIEANGVRYNAQGQKVK